MPARETRTHIPLRSKGSSKRVAPTPAEPIRTKARAPISPEGAAAIRGAHQRRPILQERDSYASTALGDVNDRSLHATAARFTLGLSPAALAAAYVDWATHLAGSPVRG